MGFKNTNLTSPTQNFNPLSQYFCSEWANLSSLSQYFELKKTEANALIQYLSAVWV